MKRFFLALSSALLLVFSSPSFDLEFFTWIALIPLFLAIKERGLKYTFSLSFLTSIIFFEGVLYWINGVKGFNLLDNFVLGVYLSSYFGIFALLLNLISKKTKFPFIITAPVLWVSIEYLRSNAGFLALPMVLIGHSQYLNIPLIQIATLTGAYGVSFLVVMVNAALSEVTYCLIMKREGKVPKGHRNLLLQIGIAFFIMAISLTYGFYAISHKMHQDMINITVIQGNISQDIKWNPLFRKQNLDKHIKLTKEAVNKGETSLIVWPETSITVPVKQDLFALLSLTALMKEINSSLLFGSSQSPKFGSAEFRRANNFNSAFLISYDKGFAGQYNKIHLFPFGEYLPFEGNIPWPARLSSFLSETGTIIPGKEYTILNLDGVQFGTVICWESIFPSMFRQFVKRGAHLMINMTNEAWFGQTAAPYQFLSSTVFRAVENRVSIARSANTGVSCFIDPYGRIIGKIQKDERDIFVEGYLTMAVPISSEKTFYTRHGDIFAYSNIIIALCMIIFSLFKLRKNK